MDSKKKILIGGGIAAVILILIVLFLVFGGEGNKDNKNTTTLQSSNQKNTEENTTMKEETYDSTTVAVDVEPSNEATEESSDEETTLAEESSSKEEETTSKKEETTTKKNNTTQKNTTASKQETTTEEQTTEKPKPKSGRIKESELAFINKCIGFTAYGYNGSMYEQVEGVYNHFIYERDVFGWENIAVYADDNIFGKLSYYEGDYFTINYPNDEYKCRLMRNMYFMKKVNDAIISECNQWVNDPSKYGMGNGLGEYLYSRYTDFGTPDSIYNNSVCENPNGTLDDMYEGKKKEWCEQWCYFDPVLNKYRTILDAYVEIVSCTYAAEGYFTDADAVIEYFASQGMKFEAQVGTCYCRWIYDAATDKTTIFAVCAR